MEILAEIPASPPPPTDTGAKPPELYIVPASADDEQPLLQRCLQAEGPPKMPLTDEEKSAVARMDKQTRPLHIVTTALLRGAGLTAGVTQHRPVERTSGALAERTAVLQRRYQAYNRQPPSAADTVQSALLRRRNAEEPQSKQPRTAADINLLEHSKKVGKAYDELHAAVRQAAGYEAVLAAVTLQNKRFHEQFSKGSGLDTQKIINEVIVPTSNLQHPALVLVDSLRPRIHNDVALPDRLLRFILLQACAELPPKE